jgi:hypothetical protein
MRAGARPAPRLPDREDDRRDDDEDDQHGDEPAPPVDGGASVANGASGCSPLQARPRHPSPSPWRGSEVLQHARIAERVRLDVREVEELRDTLVGAGSSCEYTSGSTTCSPMGAKPRRRKKSTSKVTEQPRQTELDRGLLLGHDRPADAVEPVLRDDERADLAEVFPHHVQRAADEPAVDLGDDELCTDA